MADPDLVFKALADRSRRSMVERLARGPATVSDLAAPLDMAMPTVLQHLGVLERAGVVQSAKHGRVRTFQLVPGSLDATRTWLDGQRLPAERQADRLVAFLTDPPTDPPQETDR